MSDMGWRQRNLNKEYWVDKPMQKSFVFYSTASLRCEFFFDGPDMRMRAIPVDRWLGLSG